jgi:hypothetical protein
MAAEGVEDVRQGLPGRSQLRIISSSASVSAMGRILDPPEGARTLVMPPCPARTPRPAKRIASLNRAKAACLSGSRATRGTSSAIGWNNSMPGLAEGGPAAKDQTSGQNRSNAMMKTLGAMVAVLDGDLKIRQKG